MLKTHGKSLDDESLPKLMTKVEGTLNSGPLTVEMINEPGSFQPLTPANTLATRSKFVMPPPGKFLRYDLHCRRWWRRVQHTVNDFWSLWRKEYLQSLEERQKWNTRRSFVTGDIALLKIMDVSRSKWPMPEWLQPKVIRMDWLPKNGWMVRKRKRKKILCNGLLIKLYCCSKVMVVDPYQGTNWCFLINLVITRGAICNCTLIKCISEQSARRRDLIVKKCSVELKWRIVLM